MKPIRQVIAPLNIASRMPQAALLPAFSKWIAWVAPTGDLEAKIDAMAEELGNSEQCYYLFHVLALIYWRLGDKDLAMDYFHRCIATTPNLATESNQIEAEYAAYDYDIHAVHHQTVTEFMAFTTKLLAGHSGGTIIDAACGSGLAGPTLRPLASRLVGIDLSTTMVARTQASGLYEQVVEGDMTASLAAMPHSADAIVCVGATYYLADLAPFLASCAMALKPGGLLLFTDYSAPAHLGTGATYGGNLRHCRSEAHIRALAAHAGLSEVATGCGLAFNTPCLYWGFRQAD